MLVRFSVGAGLPMEYSCVECMFSCIATVRSLKIIANIGWGFAFTIQNARVGRRNVFGTIW